MRYGDQRNIYNYWLYGHQDYNINNLWAIDTDWDGDGSYDGFNEAMNCSDIQIRRGRKTPIGSIGGGFQHADVGEARITLENYEGDYDPYNPNAPHFPHVKPGKYIRISVQNTWSGEREYLFTGVISDISVSDYGNSDRKAFITCKDGWNFLNNKVVNIGVQTDINVGSAISLILTAAGWPSIWGSSIEQGTDTLDYFWVNNKTAAQAINELVDSEFGTIVIDGNGQINFTARGVRPSTSLALTQSDILKQIKVPNPWAQTRNNVEIMVYPRKLVENVAFYTMGDTPLVAAASDLTIWGDVSYNGEAAAISVVDSLEYTANANADGTGADLTASFMIENTAYGERLKLDVTNINQTSAGHVTACIATGDLVICENSSSVFADRSGGVEAKTFKLATPWQSSLAHAENYASFLLEYLEDDTPYPIVKIKGHNDWQFGIDLFDVISLDIDTLSLDAENFRVAYLEHAWKSQNGQLVETTIYTEKNLPAGTADVDLMVNGGFEEGNLTGWTTSGAVFAVVDTSPYDGTYYLEVDETTATATLTSDRVECDEKQTYHFSCYTKEYILADDDQTVNCAATLMAYVDSAHPDSNYHDEFKAGGNLEAAYRAYLRVDLGTANIPEGVEIKTATLMANLTSRNSSVNTDIGVYRVLQTFEDTSVTWDTKPSTELQAIGNKLFGSSETTGAKEIELAPRYIEEMIAGGTWNNKGFEIRAAPEGGLVQHTHTYWYWETYISHYITTYYSEEGYYRPIVKPVYAQRLKSYTTTSYATTTNIYNFGNAPYMRVVYDATIYPNPDYSIQVKWYDDPSAGDLLRTDTLATENKGLEWSLRDMQTNSPSGAESFEIVIIAYTSDAKFFVDKIQAKRIGFY